jgi:tetratricopeptide (TPR) repeat protein
MEVRIFVSYSHRDRKYLGREELLGFLRGVNVEGDVEVKFWIDEHLAGGDRWDDEIKSQIDRAHIALILVSQAFLDSQYCVDVEVSSFLDRRAKQGLQIFPVLLSACEWDRHPWLSDYQMLPGGDETIEEHYTEPGAQKRLYLRIRKDLRQLIQQVVQSQAPKEAVEAPKDEALAERRRITLLQAVLAVDKTGVRVDPEEEIELLYEAAAPFRERFAAQMGALGGHVLDTSSSGGILACFGYPESHEDESVRAVRAGLALIESVRSLSGEFEAQFGVPLGVKVGVQTGVAITTSGTAVWEQLLRGEGTAVAVLLAARAPLSAVVVGQSTYRLVDRYFRARLTVDGELDTAGRPLKGWQIESDLGVRTRFDAVRLAGLAPMIGRESELRLATEAWHSARRGSGKVVVITAEPGLGKSRLLEEIRTLATAGPTRRIECQCSPYHQNSALYPIAQSIASALCFEPGMDAGQKLDRLAAAAEDAGLDEEGVLVLADLLSLSPAAGGERELSARQHKDRLFEAAITFLLQHGPDQPILLVVEDLHWMDPSTEELPELQMLVVCTTRPEYHPPQPWAERDYFVPVRLGQLSLPQVTQMVYGLAGGRPVPPEVVHAIYNKTDGYPLFVEDLTRMVLESGALEERDGVYVLKGGLQELAIPDTLQETLMARLHRIEGARLVAQLGAVIGREFSYEMIRAIAPLDETALKEALGKLATAGILHRRGLLSRATYYFKHALVQDALYESLLKRERKTHHRLIADLLEERFPDKRKSEPELLAHHHFEAGSCDRAIRYWLTAGEAAIARSANVEALQYAQKALQALGGVSDPAERNRLELALQTMQGPALLALRGWAAPEVGAAFERLKVLADEAGGAEQIFRATRGLWGFYMVNSRLRDSLRIAGELESMAREHQSLEYSLEAWATHCDSWFWMGNPAQAALYADRVLESYRLAEHHTLHAHKYGEDPSSVCLCYGALSHYLTGDSARAAQIAERAVREVDDYQHPFSRGFVLNGIAWYHIHTGNVAGALEAGTRLRDLAAEHDLPPWRALARTHVGWASAVQGNTDAGVAEILGGMNELRAASVIVATGLNYSLVTDALFRARRYDDALRYVNEGIEHLGRVEECHYASELHRMRGEILALQGAAEDEVVKELRLAVDLAREQGSPVLEQRAEETLQKHGAALASV